MNRHDISDKHIKRQQAADKEKAAMARAKNAEGEAVSEEKEQELLYGVDFIGKKPTKKEKQEDE